jgi:hypothetical protein
MPTVITVLGPREYLSQTKPWKLTPMRRQRLLGAGDFTATELPPDGKLIDGTLGYFLRPGGHSLKPEDWKAFLDFADKQLGPPAKPRSASAPRATGSVAVELIQSSPHTPRL